MWEVLRPTDIEQAQRQLNERRAETLRRQAEELAGLEADKADLEALDRLAAAFSSKFKKAAAPPVPAIAASKKPDLPVIQHQPVSPRPHSRTRKNATSRDQFRGLLARGLEIGVLTAASRPGPVPEDCIAQRATCDAGDARGTNHAQ